MLDVVVFRRLYSFLDQVIRVPPSVLLAARPHTRVLDIAHSLHLVVEKGQDRNGAAAIAQQDIQRFL